MRYSTIGREKMDYRIRRAKLDDIHDIIELYKKLSDCMIELQQKYMDMPQEDFGYYNEDNLKYFQNVLVSNSDVIFVAEIKEEVVGFIQASIHEKDFDFHLEQYCYIPYYYVEELYRNYSLNLKLYKEAERWALEKKLRYICSDVDGGNEISLNLQKKFCGMKPFKIRLMKKL